MAKKVLWYKPQVLQKFTFEKRFFPSNFSSNHATASYPRLRPHFLSFFRVTSNLRPEKNKESDFSLNLTKQMTDNKFIRPAFRTVFGLFDPSEMCLLHVEVWERGKSNWFIMLCVDFCVISIKCYRTNIYLMSKLFWMIYQSNFETATFGIIYTK